MNNFRDINSFYHVNEIDNDKIYNDKLIGYPYRKNNLTLNKKRIYFGQFLDELIWDIKKILHGESFKIIVRTYENTKKINIDKHYLIKAISVATRISREYSIENNICLFIEHTDEKIFFTISELYGNNSTYEKLSNAIYESKIHNDLLEVKDIIQEHGGKVIVNIKNIYKLDISLSILRE